MDILILIVIAAAAAAFTSQLVGAVVERWVDPKLITGILTAPISAVFLWLMGVTNWELAISALAAGFFAAGAMKLLNRPLAVQQVMTRR